MNRFITDLVRDYIVKDEQTSEQFALPRYAMWAMRYKHRDGMLSKEAKPVVIGVARDLETLIADFGDAPLFKIEDMDEATTADDK